MTERLTPSIDNLAITWRSIDELCSGLSVEEWARPTGCPGWSVQDNVSHLIDYEAGALGRPRPDHEAASGEHIKNPLGEMNEIGVDARRGLSPEQVLAEFREVTADRLAQLEGLTAADLDRPVDTPAGPGTVADMLTLRVMDTWSHEQDIRRATGRPGHAEGPVVEEAVRYWSQYLPYAVGKLAGAPDGSTAVFEVGSLAPVAVEVVDGRARVATESPSSPTVILRMPTTTFAALVGGRSDAPADTVIDGDEALGQQITASLGFMP